MLRVLNVVAILALVGSAVYAYSIKYATLYQAEQLAKLKRELQAEADALAMVRAEWAHVANPVRIEALADQYLGGQVMQLSQIATLSALPEKSGHGDEIGAKLQDLGLSEQASAPVAAPPSLAAAPKPGAATTPKPGAATPKTGR